ncbi:Zinc-binding alcohol dehydrogenase domain-containing protein 2-like [Plakobranchus ocellatus]|uniref:Zinc-binding alcohol dehydrogenase domain-containing protein 2-like n=1 Tax=Plakobranchus ocellatus TaxID=259542 RepID=A0AAV3Y217_9GAST|nr:Zinc-binding alcohol dehydrogenase domain-containing protein 2-like [Plakobranchus ocellatus]
MSSRAIPAQMRQIMVKKLGNKFREVTEVVHVPVPKPGPKQVLVRTSYVAINASDIMFSSGFYTPGAQPPFPAGLEAMGEIVLTGEGSKLKVGQNVVFSKFGSFSEYLCVYLHIVRGVGGTVVSEFALRSAEILLSRVRAPLPAP